MTIRITCTSCGSKLKARDNLAGKQTRCPRCKTMLLVQPPSDAMESVAAKLLASVEETPSRKSVLVPSNEIVGGIEFVCPFCEERYQVAQEMAGRSILCRNCRASANVPALPDPDEFAFLLAPRGKKEPSGSTTIMSVKGMPRPLMQKFKAWCNRRGITMKDKITELIRECLAKGD
jgi:DNA-directed RNA polymerase subunit RPC12/RpoP